MFFSEYGIYIVPAKILKLLIKKLIVWISFESCLEVNCLNHKFWTEVKDNINKGLLSKAEILLPSILIRGNLFVCLENWEEVTKFGGL